MIQKFGNITKQNLRPIVYAINKQKLSNYRLIFCISSGRAGSGYLSRLLNSAENVYGFHEPHPRMIKHNLDLVNKFPYEQTFKQRSYKVAGIKDKLLNLPEESVYCETSHMFIKTFFDVVIRGFPRQIEVIALRRFLPKVLKSFIELGYFSDINRYWPLWMSSPNSVTAAIPCITADINLDQYDLSIAYLIDIEARLLRFKSTYTDIKVHEVRVEQFNDINFIESFLNKLSITTSQEILSIYNKPQNTREAMKKKYSNNQVVDLKYCKSRIDDYIKKATDIGIEIPKTLALNEID